MICCAPLYSLSCLRRVLILAAMIAFAGFVPQMSPATAQTKIGVAVNNGIVTTNQIVQRARFLRLTGAKGDVTGQARKQLITEELQFQEAKRINFSVTDAEVEKAFGRLAQNNKTNSATFSRALRQQGVNPGTLKQLIKARILWQQIVVARARAEARQTGTGRDITSILFNRGGKGKNNKVKEYTIEQIIFILKKDASNAVAKQRLREIQAFRRSHKSCEEAAAAAKKLATSGVIMKSVGRFTSDTLPPNIRKDVTEATDQIFTPPKRGESGYGMMAVCNTREIVDNGAGSAFDSIGQLDNQELQAKSDKWLAQLRDQARIDVR